MTGLFGEEFEIEIKKPEVKQLVEKVKKEKVKKEKVVKEKTTEQILKSKKISLDERLKVITENVNIILGKQKNNVLVIRDNDTFNDYIDKAIKYGRIAIDTETNNSLDTINCKLMGLCLYVPDEKQAYVPINHINNETGKLLDNQLTENDCRYQLQRIKDANIFSVFHNYKFDYQVLKTTCGIEVPCHWDTMIAAKLIDENEHSAGLKQQYISKIDPTQEKYSIDHLFENVEYAQVDPEVFALYAGTDSMMTDKLYLWQKPIMESYEKENPDLNPYKLFKEVEMPCIQVVAEMELNGVLFNTEYANRLRAKYENKLKIVDEKISVELDAYTDKINKWKLTPEANFKPQKKTGNGLGKSKVEQLENPIALSSPTQLAILLYDILGVPVIDKENPRGTGEEILEGLKDKYKICSYLLERRTLEKMLNAFINSLPEEVNPTTGKIHCHFNQYGAGTGRTSCSNPNLQQIPSHEKSIRLLFEADPGYVLVGSDFSQQEPRLLSFYSMDESMVNAYKNGKDLYATVAAGVYHMGYWDCMEHNEDGTPNVEGKKRRASCKSIVLGLMYSRGAAAIAEQIHSTKEEAQQIIDNFYKSFPTVKTWMDESVEFLRKNGYTEDFYGRRRRLPDATLPKYSFNLINKPESFNPIIGCDDRNINPSTTLINKYLDRLNNCKFINKEIDKIKADAAKENLEIHNNGGFIARAERQCVNARIQGGAATMTKIAMNKIFRDPELNSYGFKLLINVHDELIGECKEEYADACAKRLCEVMKSSISDICPVPFKCDPAVTKRWYEDEMAYQLQEEHDNLIASGKTEDETFKFLMEENCEFTEEEMNNFLTFEK